MTTIQNNIAARDALTALLTGKPATPPALTAHEAAERLNGWVYKDDPNHPDGKAVKDAVARVSHKFGEKEALVLLQRFGVERIQDVWIGSHARIVSFADACIGYGVPPSASWDSLGGNDWKPMKGWVE